MGRVQLSNIQVWEQECERSAQIGDKAEYSTKYSVIGTNDEMTALALVSFFLTVYYLRTERDMDFVYGVLYAFYAFFLVKWIRPYAFLTLRNGRWLTR